MVITTLPLLPEHNRQPTTALFLRGDDSVTRSYRYSYDAKGNITAIYNTTATPEALIVRYTYDEACQLIREDNAELNKTVTYIYDKGGNLVSKTKYAFTISDLGTPTENIAYTYDTTWKDKLMSYGGTTLTYDEIGNPHNYTHDRLFNWVGRELREAFSEDGTRIEFAYNENGLRSLKRIYDDDTHVQDYHYFWSDDNRLLGYTLDTGEQDTADMQVLVLYNSDNEPIGFTIADMTFYYIKNIQGDVVCVTDSSGAPIVNYTYDAWGYPSISPSSDETDNYYMMMVCAFNPVTYRGYLFDMELALYYLRSRYYDPETGRFINPDRICDTGFSLMGTNMFAYCNNCPIMLIDPSGENSNYTPTQLVAHLIGSVAVVAVIGEILTREEVPAFLDFLFHLDTDIIGLFEALYSYAQILISMEPEQSKLVEFGRKGLEGALTAAIGFATSGLAETLSFVPSSGGITMPLMLIGVVSGFLSSAIPTLFE
ncbi:MAG: RHS repeat-associated core domain-containing protein [Oscillospiraceae bacterium]|nr:RHS repeat-associated core domain-containing protein [Oscillospiraceae bacterium]